MRRMIALGALLLTVPELAAQQPRIRFIPAGGARSAAPLVVANDNRVAAGTLKDGVLTVHLVVQMAEWRPNAPDGPGIIVPAFAEEGKAPQIPAPLIRVPRGTRVRTIVRNALPDSTLLIWGLANGSDTTPARIPAGASHTFERQADSAGTHAYHAATGAIDWEEQQLSGAFHVDTAAPRPDERIFVINIASGPVDSTVVKQPGVQALAINGRAWPHTERMRHAVGDTVRWIWVNGSDRPHPMHLHGFYFDVAARNYTTYAPDDRDRIVTQHMERFTTMAITWVPDRPGNWLFHCHLVFHVIPGAELPSEAAGHSHDRHMAGLVVGIEVSDSKPVVEQAAGAAIRLVVAERKTSGGPIMGYALGGGNADTAVSAPGPVLTLTRGVTTRVTVVNHLRQPTGVHWHGIELGSYSDGVAGWSGAGDRVAPMIMPRDSFVAELILPRAGTFIYHTHLNDVEQLTSGLYGAIVVLEPGERADPERDHTFVLGWYGPDEPPRILLNGDSTPPPLRIAPGRHRLRLINISPAGRRAFRLLNAAGEPVVWTPWARDGMTLPERRRAPGRATQPIGIGETFDVMWDAAPGVYTLMIGPRPRDAAADARSRIEQRIEVR